MAFLKAPGEYKDEQVEAFAKVAVKILKQLGGDYAVFAEEIEQKSDLRTFEFQMPSISFKEIAGINLQPFTLLNPYPL